MTAAVRQPQLPAMELRRIDGDLADRLLLAWAHPLGACNRPFGREDWLLEIDGEPAGLATSASTVSGSVQAQGRSCARQEVVELARVARAPDHRHILRVMVRLWREYLAARWPYWRAEVAISYAMPGTRGDIYRFDGWTREGVRKRSGGGGTWTGSRPDVNDVDDGLKTLWSYALTDVVTGEVRDAA